MFYDLTGKTPDQYWVTNGFSLNMLGSGILYGTQIQVKPVSAELVARMPVKSGIGHTDTAALVSGILGRDIQANRATISLWPGETIVVAQYLGPRLPEGATVLPEGAAVKFVLVTIGHQAPVIEEVDFFHHLTGEVHPIPQVVFPVREDA